MTKDHKLRLARLARLHHQLAELDGKRAEHQAELARIYAEMADGETAVDLETGRRQPRPHLPRVPQVSDTDRALARAALRERAVRRRLGS